MSQTISKAAMKATNIGDKVAAIAMPLGALLPVAAPNINALIEGGPMGVWNYNAQKAREWRPPDMNTVKGYVSGPGGASFMTGIITRVAKYGLKTFGVTGKEARPITMLLDAVEGYADGSALGWATREILYPSISGVEAPFSGVDVGFGGGSQPAINSQSEMATKDNKARVDLGWK